MSIANFSLSTRIITLAAAALLSSACAGEGAAVPTAPSTPVAPAPAVPVASANVAMNSSNDGYGNSSNTFAPGDVYIVRNGTVSWSNGTGITHNVNFAGATGAPANIANYSTGTQERTFPTSGTFNYSCTLHSGMTGVVRVE